jgi:hypothetical protein
MFGQQRQLGRGQLFVHKAAYCIADIMGRGGDGSDRVAIRKKASDAAIFADLDPDLKGRVLQAAKESANGKKTVESKVLEAQIEAMLEAGELEPSVAAALLRICNTAPDQETGFSVLNPSLSTRSDGGSDARERYYNPRGPAGGGAKRAGDREFMDLLKGYMDGIGRRSSPARGPALDMLKGLGLKSGDLAQLNRLARRG